MRKIKSVMREKQEMNKRKRLRSELTLQHLSPNLSEMEAIQFSEIWSNTNKVKQQMRTPYVI